MVPALRKRSLYSARSFAQVGLERDEVQRFILLGELEQLGVVTRRT
jgi:hypothetical protein